MVRQCLSCIFPLSHPRKRFKLGSGKSALRSRSNLVYAALAWAHRWSMDAYFLSYDIALIETLTLWRAPRHRKRDDPIPRGARNLSFPGLPIRPRSSRLMQCERTALWGRHDRLCSVLVFSPAQLLYLRHPVDLRHTPPGTEAGMSSLIVLDILLAVISIFIAGKWWFKPSSKPVPPGPRPLPLIGNLFNVPKTYQWKTFAEWSTRAGTSASEPAYPTYQCAGSDIVSVSLMGQRLVILHSLVAATDLLEKRSAIYSDRPPLPVSGRTLKWGEFVTFSPYGDRFREQRRYLHRYIGSRGQLSKVEPLHGLIEEETRAFLLKTMARPEEFEEHIREYVRTFPATVLC